MSVQTILWAEDDADDLQLMKEILDKHNQQCHIIEVKNGKQALDYLAVCEAEGNLPSLIILDINMPVLDGKETLAIIKQNPGLKNVPVIVFTTSSSEIDRLFCKRWGTEMFTKPPDYSALEKTVLQLLSNAHFNSH